MPDIDCHDAFGMGRHGHLDEHPIGRAGHIQCDRLGQYGLAVGFNVLQDGVCVVLVKAETLESPIVSPPAWPCAEM